MPLSLRLKSIPCIVHLQDNILFWFDTTNFSMCFLTAHTRWSSFCCLLLSQSIFSCISASIDSIILNQREKVEHVYIHFLLQRIQGERASPRKLESGCKASGYCLGEFSHCYSELQVLLVGNLGKS